MQLSDGRRHIQTQLLQQCALITLRGVTQVAALEAEAQEQPPAKTLADLAVADPWASLPRVDELLPAIVRLWVALHVPLLGRSQFLIAHEGKEVFYYMAEHAHLLELQRCAHAQSLQQKGAF